MNLLTCACCGCHVIDETTDWVCAIVPALPEKEEEKEDEETLVECALAEDGYLFVANTTEKRVTAFVSIQSKDPIEAKDGKGRDVMMGRTTIRRSEDDDRLDAVHCVTLVMILPPLTAIAPIRIEEPAEPTISHLEFELEAHPDPMGTKQNVVPRFKCFPLQHGRGPYLCTQGFGGRLTHFFPESYHAVDFRCDVGTPVLAVADGRITEISQSCHDTGIHCENLMRWNSVTLEVSEEGYSVSYVHIKPDSAIVRVGQFVKAGDVLCQSGSVGFSPEPHLHIEVHRTDDLEGPSLRFELESGLEFEPDARDATVPSRRISRFSAGKYYAPPPRRIGGDV